MTLCGVCERDIHAIVGTINEVSICDACKDWDKHISFEHLPTRLQIAVLMRIMRLQSERIEELEYVK